MSQWYINDEMLKEVNRNKFIANACNKHLFYVAATLYCLVRYIY